MWESKGERKLGHKAVMLLMAELRTAQALYRDEGGWTSVFV